MKKSLLSMAVLTALCFSFIGCTEEDKDKDEKKVTKIPSYSNEFLKFDGSTGFDTASDMVFDSESNFYTAGYTDGNISGTQSGEGDLYVNKYDSNGERICGFQFGTNHKETAENIVVDSQNNVYISGWTNGDFDSHTYIGGVRDIVVMKLNSSCEKLSSKIFGSTGSDNPTGMSIDSDDNIYITGSTDAELNNQTSEGSNDWFIMKLNTDLTEIWTTQNGSNGNDWTNDIAVDNSGHIYVVGSLDNNIGTETSVAGYEDGFIAKYNAGDGSRVWIKNFGSENDSGGTDTAITVNVASDNSLRVGFGFVDAQGAGVASFDADGTKLWQKKLSYYRMKATAVDRDGNTYYSDDGGYSTGLVKLDSQGEVVWSHSIGINWGAGDNVGFNKLLVNDNSGLVYGVGYSTNVFKADSVDNDKVGGYDALLIAFKTVMIATN